MQFKISKVDNSITNNANTLEEIKDIQFASTDQIDVICYGYGFIKSSYQKLTCTHIINFFQKEQLEFVHEIDGAFSCLIHDKVHNVLYIITDPYRLYIFYFSENNNAIYISTEIIDIKKEIITSINQTAYLEIALINCTIGNKTIYNQIETLLDGKVYAYKNKRLTVLKTYGALLKKQNKVVSVELFTDYFYEHVKKGLSQSDSVNLALTAGLDSRAVLAASLNRKEILNLYTYGFSGNVDVTTAQNIAKKLKLNYEFLPLDDAQFIKKIPLLATEVAQKYEGQLNSISHAHVLNTYRERSEIFETLFTAIGGEMYRLYYLPKNYLACKSIDELANSIRKFSQVKTNYSFFEAKENEIVETLNQSIYCELIQSPHKEDFIFTSEYYYHRRNFNSVTTRFAGKYFELFNPYYEQNMYESVGSISLQNKIHGGLQKSIIQKSGKELSSFLINQKEAIEPSLFNSIRIRKKRYEYYAKVLTNKVLNKWYFKLYFTDYDNWLRIHNSTFLIESINKPAVIPSIVNSIDFINFVNAYLKGESYFAYYRLITNIVSTQLYLNTDVPH